MRVQEYILGRTEYYNLKWYEEYRTDVTSDNVSYIASTIKVWKTLVIYECTAIPSGDFYQLKGWAVPPRLYNTKILKY